MPMDFAPNLTYRYRVTYHSNGLTHRIIFRTGEDPPATVGADLFLNTILGPIQDFLPTDFALISSEQSAPGADIFLPADIDATLTDVAPGATPSKDDGPNYLTFSGKGNDGTQYRFSIYGVSISPAEVDGKNYRFELGDNADIDVVLGLLKTDPGLTSMTTVNNRQVKFRNYANYGVSAYYQRKLR